MNSADELFQLISLLSKAEKRQFKLLAGKSSGKTNTYIKLFDFLTKQDSYDEEQLLKKFKDEAFSQHLSSTKHKLYVQILKSLSTLSTGNPIDRDLNEMISFMEILYYKGLLKQSQRWLNKAKNLAYEYEKFITLLTLFSWEKKLLHERQNENLVESFEQIINEEQEVQRKLDNLIQYENLLYKLSSYYSKQFRVRSEEDSSIVEEIAESPLIKSDSSLSISAKILYYEIEYKYLLKIGELNAAWTSLNKVNLLYKNAAKKLIESDVETFLRVNTNFFNISLLTNNLDAAKNTIENIQIQSELSNYHEIKTKEKLYYTQLIYYINSFQWDKAHELVKEIKSFIDEYEFIFKKTKLLIIHYNIAMLYFIRQDYVESLHWLNNILNQPKTDLRKDSQVIARIMRMLVLFELNNKDLLDDLIRSTQRHLVKNNYLHDFEMEVLSFLKDLTSVKNNAEVVKNCQDLEEKINKMYEAEKVKQIGQDEVLLWVKSKIHKKKIIDILQEEKLIK